MNPWLEAFEKIKPFLSGHDTWRDVAVKEILMDLYFAGKRDGIAALREELQKKTNDKTH